MKVETIAEWTADRQDPSRNVATHLLPPHVSLPPKRPTIVDSYTAKVGVPLALHLVHVPERPARREFATQSDGFDLLLRVCLEGFVC